LSAAFSNMQTACTMVRAALRRSTAALSQHCHAIAASNSSSDTILYSQSLPGIQQTRFRSKWERMKSLTKPKVPTFDYSGDNTLEDPVTIEDTDNLFSSLGIDQNEIDTAERDFFSIRHADGKQHLELLKQKAVNQFGRHEHDRTSIEVQIAILTVTIRRQIRHMQKFPKDKKMKSRLVEMIRLRTRRLNQIYDLDKDKHAWLCDELDITHMPKYTMKHYNRYIGRNARSRMTAVTEMMSVKEKKLGELRDTLLREREEYYQKKEEAMNAIEEEQNWIEKETEELSSLHIQTGYAGNMGEKAINLAHIKHKKVEKWWRKHPEVLRLKFGDRARIPDPNVVKTR